MLTKIARALAVLGVLSLATFTTLALAQAGSRELKNTGAVGETLNGYLAVIDSGVSQDVRGQVEAINAARREAYVDDAAATGRPLAEVEAVAGARLREKAQPGDWIQNAAGEWIRKQ